MKRLQRAGALAVAAAVLAWTSTAAAQGEISPLSTGPAPDQTEIEESRSTGLMVGGGLVFGAAYATSLVAGIQSDLAADRWLAIPVAGPWVALAQRRQCGLGDMEPGCEGVPLDQLGLIAAGGFQVFGAALVLIGASTTEQKPKPRTAVHVLPTAGPGNYGLTALGHF